MHYKKGSKSNSLLCIDCVPNFMLERVGPTVKLFKCYKHELSETMSSPCDQPLVGLFLLSELGLELVFLGPFAGLKANS